MLLLKKLSTTIDRDSTCYAFMVAMAADLRPVWFSLLLKTNQNHDKARSQPHLQVRDFWATMIVTDGSYGDIYSRVLKQH